MSRAKRKRIAGEINRRAAKRTKLDSADLVIDSPVAKHLLPFYYPHVTTLRSYVKAHFSRKTGELERRLDKHAPNSPLARLLDTTLIGCIRDASSDGSLKATTQRERTERIKDFYEFTQRSSGSSHRRVSDGTTIASTLGAGSVAMADLVDFAVWRLFNRTYKTMQSLPPHILCHGFRPSKEPENTAEDIASIGGIHGLTELNTNVQVERLKDQDWVQLHVALGVEGDHVILELLSDCGVFLSINDPADRPAVSASGGNYWQVSGVRLSELPVLASDSGGVAPRAITQNGFKKPPRADMIVRSPAAISFVRSRMFYARATLNGRGKVHLGLRHIHVLNRYTDPKNEFHAKHILKHIFPRQYGLHNVFTSKVNHRETAYAYKDYTLREHEISAWNRKQGDLKAIKTPKRLRGDCFKLVQRFQRLHKHCAYKELLLHYCPVQELDLQGQTIPSSRKSKRKRTSDVAFATSTAAIAQANALLNNTNDGSLQRNLVELATPATSVSAFARSVVFNVVPRELFGTRHDGEQNFQQLLNAVDSFVVCKRFENLTLDFVCRNIRIGSIDWLRPPNLSSAARMSMSDFTKRQELLHELVYYIFDSLVIPLIRSNFHVTESNDHKYRLFYFRHDVWRLISQPAITGIKTEMFREIPTVQAQQVLSQRKLGYSQMRLLPKRTTVRPITNLRRRAMIRGNDKTTFLAASINSTLKDVFSMLNHERDHQPALLRSSIFSVNELYPRLVAFQDTLRAKGLSERPLYFVKVDVMSCFDTIPQDEVVDLIERICKGNDYTIKHHAQVRAALPVVNLGSKSHNKPTRKFLAPAHATRSSQEGSFAELVEQHYSAGKRNTIFVEGARQNRIKTEDMLDLLDDHVVRNIVRIGKRYYRQKSGIPQGSILSTLLCSFFYGDFEARRLEFLRKPVSRVRQSGTTLIRLIDDFLLITTERSHAEKFLSTMLAGDTKYGITVKPEKTLTNFKPSSDKLDTNANIGKPFPWCNILINTRTLAITRDRTKTTPYLSNFSHSTGPLLKLRGQAPDLADSMTLETRKRAGAAFHRKTLAVLRMNIRAMYIDMQSTSVSGVMREVFLGLLEVAERASRYLVRLKKFNNGAELRSKAVQQTVQDVARATSVLLRKGRTTVGVRKITKAEVELMVVKAFESVFDRQQARHRETLAWLKEWKSKIQVDRRLQKRLPKL